MIRPDPEHCFLQSPIETPLKKYFVIFSVMNYFFPFLFALNCSVLVKTKIPGTLLIVIDMLMLCRLLPCCISNENEKGIPVER
jgi:hypothetical protein